MAENIDTKQNNSWKIDGFESLDREDSILGSLVDTEKITNKVVSSQMFNRTIDRKILSQPKKALYTAGGDLYGYIENKDVSDQQLGSDATEVTGDMNKSVYDQNNDGIVDKATSLNDGTNIKTALQVKTHIDDVTIHQTGGLTGTYTFNSAGSGLVATMTFTNGVLTGVTLIP